VTHQISGGADAKYYPEGYLEQANIERARTTTSNSSWRDGAQYVPIFQSPEERDAIPGVIGVPEAFTFYEQCKARSDAADVKWENKMTLQSLWYGSRWEPTREIEKIGKKPVLYVAAKADRFIPYEEQKKVFERLVGPKKFVTIDSEHLDTYMGEKYEENVAYQVAWLKEWL
jgi:hypothetical protein